MHTPVMTDEVILSTAWLGPVEYFVWMAHAAKVSIEHCESYVRQTYRNRCCIVTANGRLELAVAVVGSRKNHVPVRDVRITYDTSWNVQHWRAIESAYNNSPFFLYYRDALEPLYRKHYSFLTDLNADALQVILNILKLKPDLHYTTTYVKEYSSGHDLRYAILPVKTKMRRPLARLLPYTQVFEEKHGFMPNLSIIDLIFNKGPEAGEYLLQCLPEKE